MAVTDPYDSSYNPTTGWTAQTRTADVENAAAARLRAALSSSGGGNVDNGDGTLTVPTA